MHVLLEDCERAVGLDALDDDGVMRATARFFLKRAVRAIDAPGILVVAELNDVARMDIGESDGCAPHVVRIPGDLSKVRRAAGAGAAQRAIGEREALAIADALAVVAARKGDDLVGHAGL